jgi:post-segregation antitoxin (ccd killing protein)
VKAAEKARESYQSLIDAGIEIPAGQEEFTARYVDRVLAAFPSYGQLQNGIDLYYETSRPSPQNLVDAVIVFRDEHLREKARALDLEAAKKREEALRRKMMQERAEIWRSQAEQASLLGEMAREAGAEILALALPIGNGLEKLTTGSTRKLKNEIGRWLDATGALVSTRELDEIMRHALQEVELSPKKRNIHRLRSLLATLAEELTRIGQPNPLFASAGAGILDLQEVNL